MTTEEITTIVSAVLSALQTNSKTIAQLTAVTALQDTDSFEIDGGRRVTFGVLKTLIEAMGSADTQGLTSLINAKELQSASVTADDDGATVTLTITNAGGNSVSGTLPIATTTKAGIITAATMTKINLAYTNAEAAATAAASAMSKATNVENALPTKANLLNGKAMPSRLTPGEWPEVMLYNVVPISPLDIENYDWSAIPVGSIYLEDGLINNTPYRKLFKKTNIEQIGIVDLGKPQGGTIYCHLETGNTYRWDQSADSNLGEFVQIGSLGTDAVREFSAVLPTATVAQASSNKKSTDNDCQVFYVTSLNQFVLGVRNSLVPANWPSANVQPVHLMALNAVQRAVTVSPYVHFSDLVIADLLREQVIVDYFTFYLDWGDRDLFSENVNGVFVPYANKLYICTSNDVSYYWNDEVSSLTAISDPGLAARLFFNGNVLTGNEANSLSLSQFVALTTGSAFAYVRQKGVVITLSTAGGLKSYQWKGTTWSNADDWKEFGGSAAVGNCYNVTNEVPTQGYYNLGTAIAATYAKGLAAAGMQITFQVGESTWKTFQYIGSDTTEVNFTNQDNWVDMAGLAAGDEALINILDLCGACTQAQYYTLQYAIAAITAKESATGITYKKSGLVITYPVGDNQWETKQFNGNVSDFGEAGLWKDFGSGGDVETLEAEDDPEDGGEDAFSTGGAYNHIPKGAEMLEASEAEDLVDGADTENYNYFVLVNVDGTRVPGFTPFAIPKGGGGGGGTTKTFAINFQTSPFYAAAGGSFVIRAAIRSITMDGNNEISDTIERVDIIDRDTAAVLYSNRSLNQASSATSSTYDFVFDLSSYFTAATTRRLQLIAYDTSGATAQRAINVVAVDVTVESVQTLNYTEASVVFRTDNVKSLPMYKFPNNQGGQGILAKVEMYYQRAWHTLGQAVITDTYAHNISVNPNNAFGNNEVLYHGSYPIKIQGTDVASGVKGNIIYSCIMVVNTSETTPLVALRYNDRSDGYIRRYDNVVLEVAAYDKLHYNAAVTVKENGETIASMIVVRNTVQTLTKQVTSGNDNDVLTFRAYCGAYGQSNPVTLVIRGSAIDAALTDGASYNFDFSARSNSEVDHSIVSGQNNQFEISVDGANWSSNGFNNFLGANALAIKENVTAELNDAPFSSASIESSGYSILFQFAANNIKDNDAHLMECYDPASGAGFYVTGKHVGIYCKTGNHEVEERRYPNGEKITVGIVVEPGTKYIERNGTRYSLMKLYLNGEEAACLGYVPSGSNLIQPNNIKFNGTMGDFYLYYLIGWYNYIEWQQQFYNYLVKLSDAEAMINEYDFEDVYDGSTVNGPSMSRMAERGMPYLIESPFQGSNVEGLDNTTSTSDQIFINLTYRDPSRPWRDFIAYNVRRRNQGTTSAKRPIKNARYNLARKSKNNNSDYIVDGQTYGKVCVIKPLHTREEIVSMGYDGALWDEAAALMARNKIRVGENTIPVDVITVKVDYSDSTNVNDCGACNIMNATYRALSGKFLTPAQRYYDGTYSIGSGAEQVNLTGLNLNHSTANHPIAMFRDPDGTGASTYFYAKGNWKEDKGEQVALGFKDTPGYNMGCLNYQDESFTEYFGLPEDDTIEKVVTRFLSQDPLDFDQMHPVLLSMYCGSSYKFMRWQNNEWVDTTGTMQMVNGRWQITGDVLNPVDGYELLAYTGMDWFMGVTSIADMMAPVATSSSWVQKLQDKGDVTGPYPAWTQFFECMIDNDQLQIDLALGKKVPYNLYALLRFCNSCDYTSVSGFKSIWYNHLRYFANPRALMAYNGFTDYLAAIDQQAKNMQPMFFLDEGQSVINGVYHNSWCSQTFSGYQPALIMYPNKVYDADGLLGKDNDGGATVDPEVDPNKPSDVATGYNNPYAGYGSILWNNIYQQPTVLDDAGAEISMQTVVAAMRSSQATVDGITLAPFSPEGAMHFFMENIAYKWQKVVSSYDGERKFINFTATADAIYFYALHGLRLTAIPAFINTRFRIRDGYYRTGLFFTGVFSARINCASGAGITIKAAKTGYFGVGIDSAGDLKESVYLEAGESHTFTQFNRGDGTSIEGALLYIYQCDRIAEINFNEISLSDVANFNVFTLAEKIEIGGDGHVTMGIGSYGALRNLNLGELPFLRYLDITDTVITNVDASRCPRLETFLAEGSQLTTVSLAETSPVSVLALPSTITSLTMVNLPNLAYPGDSSGGLTFEGLNAVTKLVVSGCPLIDGAQLLGNLAAANANISRLRMAGLNATGPSSTLLALIEMGVTGIAADGTAYSESGQCSGMVGTWSMTDMVDASTLTSIQNYFPELTVYNLQYTMIEFDETVSYDGNITNLENGTKDGVLNGYEPSGHITKIKNAMHVYAGQYDSAHNKMMFQQVSDTDINYLANGESIDITDLSGSGMDLFVGLPHYWYKGINDHRNQKKYIAFSTEATEPHSTAQNIIRGRIGDIKIGTQRTVALASFEVGDVFDVANLSTNTSYNVYRRNVEGMKQVRWPGVSSLSIGAIFLDKDGKVLSKVTTNITHANSDFVVGEEYLFIAVPAGAASFVFTSPTGCDDMECIAVDSSEIEAIEPDWVEHGMEFIGVYKASIDSQMRLRSISGASVRYGKGSGDSVSSTHWRYDANGDLTVGLPDDSTVINNMKYTCTDFQNLGKARGAGYQIIDYEMHKNVANLWMAIKGRRNAQAVNGQGTSNNNNSGSASIVTGGSNSTTNKSPFRETVANGTNQLRVRTLGFEDWWCNYSEWMDNVAVNVASYDGYYKTHGSGVTDRVAPAGSVADGVWHIRMPDGTERAVRGVTSGGDSIEICRFRNGRYADVVPSRVVTIANLNSYNTYYCDGNYYAAETGRCVFRSGSNATNGGGGIVYVGTSGAGSRSNGFYGSRLAFRGAFEIVE